ncbi:hypothetical protein ACFS5N_05175 [Mucilaginibacter ximonensis]|uniref:Uncharacterized protein n=1 Tax=Mucilaginibacter ximonensis TaxID=538021 RepID=A0ABW5YAM9_9SPHI
MKRNLLKVIILFSAVTLSSCATLADLSNPKPFGDDVYYTKAKAGVSNTYVPEYVSQPQETIVRNDDYYYYGDYESRIRRFGYASPFDYDDDYYGSYIPYSPSAYADTTKYAYNPDDYTDDAYYDDLGVYSAYDFGYGDYWGYDNFCYGLAYSTFIYSGGTRATHSRDYSYSNNNDGPVFSKPYNSRFGDDAYIGRRGQFGITVKRVPTDYDPNAGGLVFTKPGTVSANGYNRPVFTGARPGGSNAVYPGRPGTNPASTSSNGTTLAGTNRPIRQASEAPRSQTETSQPSFQRSSSPPPSSSSSSGGSSGGGGGRPVRP